MVATTMYVATSGDYSPMHSGCISLAMERDVSVEGLR